MPGTPSVTPSRCRELLQDGLVELVPPGEGDLPVRDVVRSELLGDSREHLRRDVLVGAAEHEREPRGAQPPGDLGAGEIQIRGELAAPQYHPVDARLPHGGPAAHGGRSLREPQGVHRHTRAIDPPEAVGVHRVQVPHVVVDLRQAIFPRQPGRPDAALGGTLGQVEARQALGRDEVAPAVVQHAQLFQEPGGQLTVAVTREPDLPRTGRASQREIARRARDRHPVFLQAPLPSMRNGKFGMRNVKLGVLARMTLNCNSAFHIPHFTSPESSPSRAAPPRTARLSPAPRAPARSIRARPRARDARSSRRPRSATPPRPGGRWHCSNATRAASPAAPASRPRPRAPSLRAPRPPAPRRRPPRRAARSRATAGKRPPTALGARRPAPAPSATPAPARGRYGIDRGTGRAASWSASRRVPDASAGRRGTARPRSEAAYSTGRRRASIRTRRTRERAARSRAARSPPPRSGAPAPCAPASRADTRRRARPPPVGRPCRSPSRPRPSCPRDRWARARAVGAIRSDSRSPGCSAPAGRRRGGRRRSG